VTTWREEISEALLQSGESWTDVVSHTLSEEELDLRFDNGFGWIEGPPFTVWTKNRVYFPVVYDGYESVGSVSRNPDGAKTEHVGGG
jgi:hypothetical protein